MSLRSHEAAAEPPPANREGRPQVVYLMGAGRSGSTILGTTLGNCDGIFFAGELARWHRRAGAPLDGTERGRFWSDVREELGSEGESLGREARFLQRSSALFRIRSWPTQRRLRAPYRRVTRELYRAIARTASVPHIVDSSHFPRRARELQTLSGIDLYLLFLVRDPQSVVAAYARGDVVQGPKFDTLATNGYLWLTNLLSLFVFLRHPRARRLLVRHEDFIADPYGVTRDILDCVGSSADLPDFTALRTDSAFLGNRMVKTGVVALKSRPETAARRSRITALLQAPWSVVLARLKPRAGVAGFRADAVETAARESRTDVTD